MYTTLIYTSVLLISTAISTVIYNAFKPNIKGWIGEQKVNKVLKKLQKQKAGKSIKDITLLSDEGLSTQIDNIFINKSGVFIIEAKNYSGIISGEENSHKWKQQIGKKDTPGTPGKDSLKDSLRIYKHIFSTFFLSDLPLSWKYKKIFLSPIILPNPINLSSSYTHNEYNVFLNAFSNILYSLLPYPTDSDNILYSAGVGNFSMYFMSIYKLLFVYI